MNISRREIKKRANELYIKFEALLSEVEELRDEVENEAGDIEPYDGRQELTAQQEERQEWLENVASALDEIVNADILDTLENIVND